VIRKRLGRFLTVSTSAVLALMLLGVGSVSAALPDWDIIIVPTPDKVGPGHDAGFVVTVLNEGPSQINALSVTTKALDTPNAAPTYLSTLVYSDPGGSTACSIAVPQTCQIGTLVAGQSVTFTVAYAVPLNATGNFELNVAIKAGTGDTDSDGPKKSSRGDAYDETESATIGGGNFDGGFVVGADVYLTNPSIGNRNIQSTQLESAPQNVPVTIEDGPAIAVVCDVTQDPEVVDPCDGLFAEWSDLNVNNGNGGAPFGTAFKVTLVIRGSAVPGGTSEEDVQVVHVLDNGSVVVIGDEEDETCTPSTGTPTNPECLTVTKVGSNWKIEVWLFQNGFVRGGI
jgi:hypothetical protein